MLSNYSTWVKTSLLLLDNPAGGELAVAAASVYLLVLLHSQTAETHRRCTLCTHMNCWEMNGTFVCVNHTLFTVLSTQVD